MKVTDVQYRSAIESDLSSIQELYNYYITHSNDIYDEKERGDTYMKNWWDEKQEKSFPVIIAQTDAEFAGFATYSSFRRWEGYKITVEHSVYVKAKFQGRGIGKDLMQQLLAHAKESNFHSMIGGIDSTNKKSIAFHQKMGFEIVGQIPDVARKNGQWLNLVLMQKILNEHHIQDNLG